MFTLNAEKTKLVSDAIPVDQGQVDRNSRPRRDPGSVNTLVIHAIQASLLQNAVNNFLSNARSLHLLIEKNGTQIAQMVDFNRVAIHENEYDENSVGIGLVYPGYLTDTPGFFYSRNRFDPLEVIFAQSVNDNKQRWYPFYPQEQLDALLEITRLLVKEFKIERILMRQEINKSDLIFGPAFPINRLRQLVQGEGTGTELLEETSSAADLFREPGGKGLKLLDQPVPARTPLAVTDEDGDWVLVEMMATVGERRWTVGWMKADKVAVKPFEPTVNDDHLLVTKGSRRIQYISAHPKNYNSNPRIFLDPQFVVIHFTTGTNMMSTVHTFLNPGNGVSTHLLVGRTGRVVQFVPFNKVAYHCGLSTWEGDRDLNRLAIGIEVDNAGYLLKTPNGYKIRDKFVPEDQVEDKIHWKEKREKHWQKFTEEQIQVVEKIVKALKAKYLTIREIVGHDMVNLINRLDPGPLYPLGELRKAVLGDPQQAIQAYRINKECPIYENFGNRPPHFVDHPNFGELPEKSMVRVREVYDDWILVIVKGSKTSKLVGKVGWVRANSIEPEKEKTKTKAAQILYEFIPAQEVRLPPVELSIGKLPVGSHVRIQFESGKRWALVAPVLKVRKNPEGKLEVVVPEDKVPKKFREGWVLQEFLEKV